MLNRPKQEHFSFGSIELERMQSLFSYGTLEE